MSNLVSGAMQKWTKLGSRQDKMVAYEVDQQIDAYRNLKYRSAHEPGVKIGVANDCLQQWTRDYIQWQMVEYCYKQTLGLN